jgi:hypothetical protein
MTRLQAVERAGEDTGLPEIDDGLEHIVDIFGDVGPSMQTPMGECALDWPSIMAFATATSRISEPWEFQTIIDMSRGYVSGKQLGDNSLAIAPVDQEGQRDQL